MAQDFRDQFAITAPLYTDPKRLSYNALGFEHGVGLGLKSLRRGARAASAGFRQGRTQGDPWQQGGVALFDAEGQIRWKSIDDGAGEQVDLPALQAAIAAL